MPKKLFTSETARAYSAKGHEAKKKRKEEIRLLLNPVPPPTDDSYIQKRLHRVRGQIELISDYIDKAKDPMEMDKYASALSRLSELERQLANRPLPGSRRPGKEQPTRKGPVMLEPEVPQEASSSGPTYTMGSVQPASGEDNAPQST